MIQLPVSFLFPALNFLRAHGTRSHQDARSLKMVSAALHLDEVQTCRETLLPTNSNGKVLRSPHYHMLILLRI